MLDVSVIILNYKTPKMCCDCIKSLREHSSGFTYEIIVIDNNSCDDTKEILTTEFGDSIRLLMNDVNLGTAKAFNQGCKNANGEYLFFLNTDILFINNAIKCQLDFIKSKNDVAVVGGNLFNSKEEPTHSYIKNFFGLNTMRKQSSLFGVLWYKLTQKKFNREFNYSSKPIKVDYVCAAATLMRKDIYEMIGGFDERIFIYGDEALYSYQCKNKGYFSYNVPDSKIIHFEGDSFKKEANLFSEARTIRYYNGMRIHMETIYGVDKVQKYYKYRRRLLSNKMRMFKLLHRKDKASKCKSEIEVLDRFIKGEL